MQILFTSEDLGRVRLALDTDLALECIFSAQLLRQGNGGRPFEEWLAGAQDQLRRPDALRAAREMAALTPEQAFATRSPTAAMHTYQRAMIDPHRLSMGKALAAEQSRRAGVLCHGGSDALLKSFAPDLRWTFPYLDLPGPPDVLALGGRGLLFVPSYFCRGNPIVVDRHDGPPALVYPVDHRSPARPSGIASLVGVSRASVLEVVGTGACTSELAQRVGISVATASHHAAVLRGAGLVVTRREGNRMVHAVTRLGSALLRQDDVSPV